MSTLRFALTEAGVKTKPLPKKTEFAIKCFKCNDTGMHMYVNEGVVREGVRGWCYCHRRGCVATVKQLAIHYQLLYDYDSYRAGVTTTEAVLTKLANLGFEQPVGKISIQDSWFNFDQFESPLTSKSFFAQKAKTYLNNRRGFSDPLIALYDFRFADAGDYAGRIIIPFTERGELVYFQARSYLLASTLKVLNPPEGVFIGGKSEYLYNFDRARLFPTVVIAEGWASAVSCGLNGVAINGNAASDIQLEKLLEYWDNYVVVLDNGVEDKTFDLAESLLHRKPKSNVSIVLLPEGDPNDYTFKEMKTFISNAKRYHSVSEIKAEAIKFPARGHDDKNNQRDKQQ